MAAISNYSNLVPTSPRVAPTALAAAIKRVRIEPMPFSISEMDESNSGTLLRGETSKNGLEAYIFHAPVNLLAKGLPNVS